MAKDLHVPVTLRGNRLEAKAQLGQTVKVPGKGGAVKSVNGKTGDVVLTAEDVGAMPSDTPIPSVDGYATEEWVEEQGYLKEHQDLSAYALKSDIPAWHEKKCYQRKTGTLTLGCSSLTPERAKRFQKLLCMVRL